MTRPHNLPNLLTSFIGRQREMADGSRLLSEHRLLTLTGPGGSGKTRLGIELAHARVEAYADGVWLVELAQLSDAALIPQTVASVLGLYEAHGFTPMQRLIDFLKPKELLLILDNCEHLVDDCARLAYTLLTACPNLHILATSREPLHIAGEVSYLTPPLLLPDPKQEPEPARLMENEAVRLFVERARDLAPDFALTPGNMLRVIEICRQLDGIPLAIELAARRVKALSPAQIAAYLKDSLGLLAGSDRMAPSRQQTLRAALDWSFDLLADDEQHLFSRLAVFAGEFSLEDVAAVCSCDPLGPENIIDPLTRLIDKSFVIGNDHDSTLQWYRLLEPIRQYGLEKLESSGELPELRNRHLEAYHALAQRSAKELDRLRSGPLVALLEREIPNLRSALHWSLTLEKNPILGARLACLMVQFWQLRGYLNEGLAWMEAALGLHALFPDDLYAQTLSSAGFLAIHAGKPDQGRESIQTALQIFQNLGDRVAIAQQQQRLGWLAMQQGDPSQAGPLIEGSLEVHRKWGTATHVGFSLYMAGELAYLQADYPRARRCMQESLSIFQQEGNLWAANRRLTRLGQIAVQLGQPEQAQSYLEESLRMSLASGDQWGLMMGLVATAALSVARGVPQLAVSLLSAADAIRERFAARFWRVDQMEYERNLTAARTTLNPQAFSAGWEEGQALAGQDLERIATFAATVWSQPPVAPTGPTGPGQVEGPGKHLTTPQAAKARYGGLTARERQVAALIAAGKSNPDIASELFVGIRTVEAHVTRILAKLDYTSRTQIALWARDVSLPETHPQ